MLKKLAKIVKKDGKHIYQAKFADLELADYAASDKGKSKEEQFLGDIASAYSFRVTPAARINGVSNSGDVSTVPSISPVSKIMVAGCSGSSV